ncbi:PglL family O-oligosaccharyltransferase [Methylomarinum vadi]|uniref:PglL family O-oligosaccharyltransferase n=1 Tax=Methylomarinum vadi TaxID=438855 RepID=UPI0004DFCE00|nr:O-antigen ligase family protein [Methylomarinum vadi]
MELVKKPVVYGLMVLLFLVAPFYYQPNLGRTGFSLPFNITVWAVAITMIFYSFLRITIENKIILPSRIYLIFAFPILLIVSSLFSGYMDPNEWMSKQVFIFCGIFFLLSLFQFGLDESDIDNILFVISLSVIIHSGLGFLQNMDISFVRKALEKPTGVFQQINVQASYLSTGILVNFFLFSRENLAKRNVIYKMFLMLSVFISAYMLSNSGSRMGIISLVFGIGMLFTAYRKEYLINKNTVIASSILLLLAMFLGRSGLGTVVHKGHEMVQGNYADLRMVIYTVSINIIKAEPLWGHGLGSFISVWNQYAPEFYGSHPGVQRVPELTHPHNELIMWFIETGLLGVIGILLFCYKILESAIKCGWKNGVGYLALLLPISFHTQVEFPFYMSSLHWFLWLFLLYLLLRKAGDVRLISLNITSAKVFVSLLIVVYLPVMYFFYNCEMARRDLYSYIHKQFSKESGFPLQTASSNIFFQKDAERLAMQSLMFVSLKNKDVYNVKFFLKWAEQYIQVIPDKKILENMAKAYGFLGQNKERCDIVKRALVIYPENEALLEQNEKCHR